MNPFLWIVVIGAALCAVYLIATSGTAGYMRKHDIAMQDLREDEVMSFRSAHLYVSTDDGRNYAPTDRGLKASAADLKKAMHDLDLLDLSIDAHFKRGKDGRSRLRFGALSRVLDDDRELAGVQQRIDRFKEVLEVRIPSDIA
jgi:hypothetical protein